MERMIRQHVTQVDRLQLPADQNSVRLAIQWLDAIGEREKWSAELKFSLSISVDEVLANIVSYAFIHPSSHNAKENPDTLIATPTIVLRCLSRSTHVQIEVIDNGHPFDPTQTSLPSLATSLEQARVGGHGLRLMRHYLSAIAYSRRAGHNCLRLIARAKKTGPISGTNSE